MRAGRLRHRLELQQAETVQDEFGQPIKTWVTRKTVWGAIEPLSGKEYFSQSAMQNEAKVRIVIRSHPDIDSDWRILARGKTYAIESVLNLDERDRQMTIMCLEGVKTA